MSAPRTSPSPAQARLDAIRARVSLASPDWGVVADGRLTMVAGKDGDFSDVLFFAENAYIEDRELVQHAYGDLRWLLDRYDIVVGKLRALQPETPKQAEKNPYAKACAILCGKQAFRQFLTAEYGLDGADGERVKTKVRFILKIQSRTELDTDDAARERWFSLVRQFNGWEARR